jgi:hypothetical protein
MSKFSDLCASYAASRNTYFAYRDQSYAFARELISRYIAYLEIPEKNFRFEPLDKDPKPGSTYSLPGAIHLNEDTYWHLGFEVTLFTAPNEYPQQPVLFSFMFKGAKDAFHIRISEDDAGHLIHPGNESEFTAFFEFLQRQVQRSFETELQCFLEQSALPRKIGFIQSDA